MTKKEMKKRIAELEAASKEKDGYIEFFRDMARKMSLKYFTNDTRDKYVKIISDLVKKTDTKAARDACDYILTRLCREIGFYEVAEIYEKRFKSENEIGKSTIIELPRIIHPNEQEWFVQYQYETGIFGSEVYYSETEAQKRLEGIKNGKDAQ